MVEKEADARIREHASPTVKTSLEHNKKAVLRLSVARDLIPRMEDRHQRLLAHIQTVATLMRFLLI